MFHTTDIDELPLLKFASWFIWNVCLHFELRYQSNFHFLNVEDFNLFTVLFFFPLSGKCLGSQDYLELANRFPQQAWEEARQFFLKKEKK